MSLKRTPGGRNAGSSALSRHRRVRRQAMRADRFEPDRVRNGVRACAASDGENGEQARESFEEAHDTPSIPRRQPIPLFACRHPCEVFTMTARDCFQPEGTPDASSARSRPSHLLACRWCGCVRVQRRVFLTRECGSCRRHLHLQSGVRDGHDHLHRSCRERGHRIVHVRPNRPDGHAKTRRRDVRDALAGIKRSTARCEHPGRQRDRRRERSFSCA